MGDARYTNDMRKRDQERRKKDFGALPGTEGNLEMYCFSLPHTGDIHNSGYIKFSTLSVLSVFDAPELWIDRKSTRLNSSHCD